MRDGMRIDWDVPVPMPDGTVLRADVYRAGPRLRVPWRGAVAGYVRRGEGHGMFLHGDPDDRPAKVFGGTTTLVSGPQHPSHLLLPVIPRVQDGSPPVRRGPYPR